MSDLATRRSLVTGDAGVIDGHLFDTLLAVTRYVHAWRSQTNPTESAVSPP